MINTLLKNTQDNLFNTPTENEDSPETFTKQRKIMFFKMLKDIQK